MKVNYHFDPLLIIPLPYNENISRTFEENLYYKNNEKYLDDAKSVSEFFSFGYTQNFVNDLYSLDS
jgi:hypothetical protein